MLTCREVTEMASAYLDRELSWPKKAQFRLHLMMCRHCRQYVDQLAKTVTLLQHPPAAPDVDTEDRLAAIFRAAGADGGQPRS